MSETSGSGTLTGRPLVKKIAAIMAEINRIPKRGRHNNLRYDYVQESDLVDLLREHMAERGVVIFPSVREHHMSESRDDRGRAQFLTTVTLEITIIDSESGDQITTTWIGQGFDSGDKGYYKAYTGAMKYFLLKTFLISTGDEATTPMPPPRPKPQHIEPPPPEEPPAEEPTPEPPLDEYPVPEHEDEPPPEEPPSIEEEPPPAPVQEEEPPVVEEPAPAAPAQQEAAAPAAPPDEVAPVGFSEDPTWQDAFEQLQGQIKAMRRPQREQFLSALPAARGLRHLSELSPEQLLGELNLLEALDGDERKAHLKHPAEIEREDDLPNQFVTLIQRVAPVSHVVALRALYLERMDAMELHEVETTKIQAMIRKMAKMGAEERAEFVRATLDKEGRLPT